MKLQDVKGNSRAKYAIEAALTGNHKITLVDMTGADTVNLVEAALSLARHSGLELDLNVVKPCPCGAYGNPLHECSCSTLDLQRHATETLPRLRQSIIVVEAEAPTLFLNVIDDSEDTVVQRILANRRTLAASKPAQLSDLPRDMQDTIRLAVQQGWSQDHLITLLPTVSTIERGQPVLSTMVSIQLSRCHVTNWMTDLG